MIIPSYLAYCDADPDDCPLDGNEFFYVAGGAYNYAGRSAVWEELKANGWIRRIIAGEIKHYCSAGCDPKNNKRHEAEEPRKTNVVGRLPGVDYRGVTSGRRSMS